MEKDQQEKKFRETKCPALWIHASLVKDCLGAILSATQKDRLALRVFDITNEAIFIFQQVHVGALDFTMAAALFDFGDDELEPASGQRRRRDFLECFQIAHRRRVLDARAPRDDLEIGLARGRCRLADARAAVNLVVEDEDGQVLRAEIRHGRKIEKRQQDAPVGFQDDDPPMGQGHGEPAAHRQRAPHRAEQQIAVAVRKLSPFDTLAAERRNDELIVDERGPPLEKLVSDNSVNSPVKSRTTGSLSACIMRTASLMRVSRFSPSVTLWY